MGSEMCIRDSPSPKCSFYHTFCTSSAQTVNQDEFSSYLEEIVFIGRIFPAQISRVKNVKGLTVKGQFCTMEKHLIHSNAVSRVKGQECKGVNGQGSILYNGDSSHLSFLDLL